MESIASFFDCLLPIGFRLHDDITDFVGRRYPSIKMGILIIACLPFLIWVVPGLSIFERDAGSLAGNLLIGILFLSPLSALLRMRLLLLFMGLRREFGILIGTLAIVHGAGYFFDPVFVSIYIDGHIGRGSLSLDRSILAGLIGLFFIVVLLVTSNQLSIRMLGSKGWKRLHRLVYPAFFLIVIHRFFRIGGSWDHIGPFVDAVLLIGSYLFLKFLVWKPDIFPPLRDAIGWVAHRYARYRSEIRQGNIS